MKTMKDMIHVCKRTWDLRAIRHTLHPTPPPPPHLSIQQLLVNNKHHLLNPDVERNRPYVGMVQKICKGKGVDAIGLLRRALFKLMLIYNTTSSVVPTLQRWFAGSLRVSFVTTIRPICTIDQCW